MSAAAHLLRRTRREAGLTQAELAARMGTTQSAIARMERAGANPTVDWLGRALRAMGRDLAVEAPPSGIDESQLRERLRLTPAERLELFVRSQRGLDAFRSRARRVIA